MNIKLARRYSQTLRAQQMAENEERVLDAAERLFGALPYESVTLAAIAQEAGVSIPTVQRRFGAKEEVFAAAGARVRERIETQRGRPTPTDPERALRLLLDHYEADGDATLHFLRQEGESPQIARMLAGARALHRDWVETVFAEALAPISGARRRRTIDTLFAATDLYVWKLLRRDLGRSLAEVNAIVFGTVRALTQRSK